MGQTEASSEQSLLEALRTSEARFRAICEAAPVGIYVSEIPNGVVYVNPSMQRMFGRPAEELLGESWKRYLHPDDAPSTLGRRAAHYDRSAAMRISARYLKGDGSVIWTQLHAVPLTERGELRGYVGVIEDVTEHKALQAQLVMAGRLASVGTLAAGVAHEVNTPLAVMLANLEWVERQLGAAIENLECRDEHGPEVAARLRILEAPLNDVRDAAERVSLIMKDLTLFSRPETAEQGAAELGPVLDSAARMAAHELKHRARLVHDYGSLPWVQGSESRLGQVFLNLLINAAHAIPEGQEGHEVRVSAREAGPERVTVEVRDTGGGIDPSVVDRIFDPFFTTKDKNLGTGLGLAICHRIVSDVGGSIEVESEPGKGSVFRVHLRRGNPAARAVSSPGRRPVEAARAARVLAIDDDAAILRTVMTLIGKDGEVRATTSAREALAELVRGARYDVVLCDLTMPDMSGVEFYQQLTEKLPEMAARVVFVTGGAVTNADRDFLDRVSNRTLKKPFTAQELKRAVSSGVGS